MLPLLRIDLIELSELIYFTFLKGKEREGRKGGERENEREREREREIKMEQKKKKRKKMKTAGIL